MNQAYRILLNGVLSTAFLLSPVGAAAQQGVRTPWPPGHVPALTPLLIEDVTVIDVRDGQRLLHQTVLVDDRRIQALGHAGALRRPARARVVSGRGKYLIPGLWDMHIHPMNYPHIFYPLLIAHGVTGIRDASSTMPLDTLHLWRQEIAAGRRVGPRAVFAGPAVGGRDSIIDTTSHWYRFSGGRQNHIPIWTADDARRAVDSLQAAGADYIKAYVVKSELYFAMLAEARKVGIPFGGHLPADSVHTTGQAPSYTVPASDSGARYLDHAIDLAGRSCIGDSASLARCAPVAARLLQNESWIVTSFTGPYGPQDPARFWPDSVYQILWPGPDSVWRGVIRRSAAEAKAPQTPLPRSNQLHFVQQAGIPVVSGTDTGPAGFGGIPGLTLLRELEAMERNGMTPLTVLQTATLNPARALHATDSLGTIVPGKLADLVLLDADPLADITNLEKIRAVVANGRYFDRAALDALMTTIERAAHP